MNNETPESVVAEWVATHRGDLDNLWRLLIEAIKHMSDPEHVSAAYSLAYAVKKAADIHRHEQESEPVAPPSQS